MNRFKRMGLILALLGTLLLGSGVILGRLMAEKGYRGNVTTTEHEFSGIRELVAISTSLPIDVRYGDETNVRVKYTGALPLVFSEENGLLRITQDDTFTLNLFSVEQLNAGIEIILPHKPFGSITLSSSSGNITAHSLNADTYEISTKSGDISLGSIDDRAAIRSESGNISFSLSSINGDMTVNGGDGDIIAEISEEASFCLEFLTYGGHFTSYAFDKEYDYSFGDAAAIRNGGKHLLRINTKGGNLSINLKDN